MIKEILKEIGKELIISGINELDDIISHPGETQEEREARKKKEKQKRKEQKRIDKIRQLEFEAEQRRIRWERRVRSIKNKENWYMMFIIIFGLAVAIAIVLLCNLAENEFISILGAFLGVTVMTFIWHKLASLLL